MAKIVEVTQNIARMKVNQFIKMFAPLIANSKTGKELPAVNLSSPPGTAKSSAIHQLGEKVEEMTGKKVVVRDVRLLTFNPVDLRGIPSKVTIKQKVKKPYIVDGQTKYKMVEENIDVARWLRPEIFQMEDSDDVINILFLDEITAAPPSVQAAAYQLVLDRRIGEHLLASNTFVFCAGNRVTDKSVAYKMPKALANRMLHIEFYVDMDDWKIWAINHNIDSRIIGFLNWKNEMLFRFDPNSDDLSYPTPRSWEMCSNVLKKINNTEVAFPLIAAAVGIGAANEFVAYTKVYHSLPDVNGIFEGKPVKYPVEMDVAYALSSSIVNRANKATKKQISNLLTWLNNWRTDYAILTIKDCAKNPKLAVMFSQLDEWTEWCTKHNDVIID